MKEQENVIFKYSLRDIADPRLGQYVAILLCRRGECTFGYNSRRITLRSQDIAVSRCARLSPQGQSHDCLIEILLLNAVYINSFRDMDYAVKGQMELFLNPVLHLTSDQMMVMRANFQFVSYHQLHQEHHYYDKVLQHGVQLLLLDLFDILAQRRGQVRSTSRYSNLMKGFMAMLERGDYHEHRDVDHYAQELCVSAKHLARVSRQCAAASTSTSTPSRSSPTTIISPLPPISPATSRKTWASPPSTSKTDTSLL